MIWSTRSQWPSKKGFVAIETFSNQTPFNFGKTDALCRLLYQEFVLQTYHLH